MVSSWDNILKSNVYPKDDLEKGGEEESSAEVKQAFGTIVWTDMNSKILNLYKDEDKTGENHGMWVPKIQPVQEYHMVKPEPDEDDDDDDSNE